MGLAWKHRSVAERYPKRGQQRQADRSRGVRSSARARNEQTTYLASLRCDASRLGRSRASVAGYHWQSGETEEGKACWDGRARKHGESADDTNWWVKIVFIPVYGTRLYTPKATKCWFNDGYVIDEIMTFGYW